jgi:hypothetical protein
MHEREPEISVLPEETVSQARNRYRQNQTIDFWPPSPLIISEPSDNDDQLSTHAIKSKRDRKDRKNKNYQGKDSKKLKKKKKSKKQSNSRRQTSSDEEMESKTNHTRSNSQNRSKKRSRSPRGLESDLQSKSFQKTVRKRKQSSSGSSYGSDSNDSTFEFIEKKSIPASHYNDMDSYVGDEVLDVIGPLPAVPGSDGKSVDPRAYGHALLAGEGSAMAAFVQEGKRIPRRGEIGLKGDQIEQFETVGYVMSGSRHQRMNAVRLRKENQVISAEERRKLLMLHAEEKLKKEAAIMADFKELVATKVKQVHQE